MFDRDSLRCRTFAESVPVYEGEILQFLKRATSLCNQTHILSEEWSNVTDFEYKTHYKTFVRTVVYTVHAKLLSHVFHTLDPVLAQT